MFYSQLVPRVIRTRSAQAVVYLECHVVSFEYFVSLYNCNNRFYITYCDPQYDNLLSENLFYFFKEIMGIILNYWKVIQLLVSILKQTQ